MWRKFYFGPPNWVVSKWDSEHRRAFGFWVVVAATAAAPFLGSKVLFVTVLSIFALIPNFTTETPTETEDE